MKNKQVLYYDEDCPMCRMYSSAFVKSGMLEQDGRSPYQSATNACVDWDRAKTEIAFVDDATNEVSYGVDSLIKIITGRYPWMKSIANGPLYPFWQRLYRFVSYNRKLLMPGPAYANDKACTPSGKEKYHIAYILLTCVFTSTVLMAFSPMLKDLVAAGPWYREWLVCFGQVLVQGIIVDSLDKSKAWHYLGHMMTVSLIGALLLLPALIVTGLHPLTYLAYFGAVVAYMFRLHWKRVAYLQLSKLLCFTWVLYRSVVLAIILFL